MEHLPDEVKKILIIQLRQIGDVLLTTPVMSVTFFSIRNK